VVPESDGVGRLPVQTTLRRIARLMVARLVLSVGVFGVALVFVGAGREGAEGVESGLYGTIGFAFTATLVYAGVFRFIRSPARFGAIQLATDIGIVTSLVFFSGGADSIFSFLYLPITVYGAVLFDRRGAYGTAVLASASYGAVLLLAEPIEMASVLQGTANFERVFALWVVHTSALLLVALLSSALARELRIAGEALNESASDLTRLRHLHEHTVDSLNSGLLTTDSDGRVSSINPEAERISGRTLAEVLGRDVEEILPAEVLGRDVEETLPGVREVLMVGGATPTGGRLRARMPLLHPSGQELHLGLASSVLRDGEGSANGWVVIFQDVTEVVAMEQELRRSERLAGVGQLAADIAHEIRNPLAAISGSVEMLEAGRAEDDGDPEPRRLMGIVLREIDRLNDLITEFLQFARPAPTKRTPFDLGAVVEEVMGVFEVARPEGVCLEVDVDGELTALADPTQVRQVLWNLILNAVQAMPEGGALRVSVARVIEEPQEGALERRNEVKGEADFVEVTVADTGVGIAPEVLERIFDPFFTTKRDGSGLGLATVHRIVEANGGSLRVESQVGKGTVLRVRFSGPGETP
jgi:two-component system sensor histidine kinase PilS (NtrC family)